jgi:AcrR family transcriptional regulator
MHENHANVQLPIRERTRAALLDGAERMLARVGYAQLTMEMLAEESGVARRTAYLYFRGKEQVVLGTVDRIVGRVTEALTGLARADEPAALRLERMLVARVLIRLDSVRGYHQALDGLFASLRPAILERRRAWFAREASQLAAVLRAGQRSGELAPGDARKRADLLILCTNALLPHGLSTDELADRGQAERRARAVAQLLLDGLRAQPARRAQARK